MMSSLSKSAPAVPLPAIDTKLTAGLLAVLQFCAAIFLAADLLIVIISVVSRFFFGLPLIWADDVARALMMAMSFFGAAAAMAKGEQAGVTFFVDKLGANARSLLETLTATITVVICAAFAYNAFTLVSSTLHHTVGAGIPQVVFFAPMAISAVFMTCFALIQLKGRNVREIGLSLLVLAVVVVAWVAFSSLAGDQTISPLYFMGAAFVLALISGMPIGFVLAFTALIYIWTGDMLPGEIFAQQMARGIDNFVLLAVPFFILVGYLMEANGMSVRLIALLQRGIGQMRGGLNIVMIISMVIFSGISGSKMADVAAVGSVLVPAARKSKQNPSDAVALLASSAIMAETIPPCINLIILGFVANVSISGLFMAGLIPAALMAAALVATSFILGSRATVAVVGRAMPMRSLVVSGLIIFGLIALIFGGYRSGLATATEASAFAALYALVIGFVAFREMSWATAFETLKSSSTRAGMVMFIVAAAQSLAYTLTLQQVPHYLADLMVSLTAQHGSWLFMLLSIAALVIMGAILEGPAALIIFGPLLMPVAKQLGIDPLHYGVVLVIGMGVGLFAPPLGVGLYSACLIGDVKMEDTIKPIAKYLGVIFICLIMIAYIPWLSTVLPRAAGY